MVVHPLCLLSTVDHYNRVLGDSKGGSKRVVGVLLGSSTKGTVDVTNSFAVPFEEDAKNPGIFFLDHNYLDTMFKMYKKVNGELFVYSESILFEILFCLSGRGLCLLISVRCSCAF